MTPAGKKCYALDVSAFWSDAEGIVVNVHMLYRAFSGDTTPVDIVARFGHRAQLARQERRGAGGLTVVDQQGL